MSEQKFVLFDFDGVIADSFSLSYAIQHHFFPRLTEQAYREMFGGNIYESHKLLIESESPVTREEWFAKYMPRMKDEVHLFKGMDSIVRKIADQYALVIISSGTNHVIEDFLVRHDLELCFRAVLGADVHESKVEKIRMVFERFDTSPAQSVFITDTLGDMKEAKEHELGVIACSWGYHERAVLEQGLPFRIVDEPAQLPDAVEDFFVRSLV